MNLRISFSDLQSQIKNQNNKDISLTHNLRLPFLLAKINDGSQVSRPVQSICFFNLFCFRPAAARKFVDEGITSLEG